ncbi:hypothetical protein D3C77_616700 [compost metagenome]
MDSIARSFRFNVTVVCGHFLWSIGRLEGFEVSVSFFNRLNLCFIVADRCQFTCRLVIAALFRFQANLLAGGIELYIDSSHVGNGPHRQIRCIVIGDGHQLFAITVC